MNWLENALGVLSPRLALLRARDRILLGQVRAYEAAAVNRKTSGWNPAGSSGNAELLTGFGRIRNRARQMVRDNEYAAAAIDGLSTGLIGTGITVRPALAAERKLWDEWYGTKACDADGISNGYGLQRLQSRTWFESGECLIRRRIRRPSDGLPVPLQLQVLEPDMLDDTKTGIFGGNAVIMGIEFDRIGRRVAYWMWDEHPGETGLVAARMRRESRRIPATEIIHLFDRRRPSQVRDVSRLAVSLMRLRNTADWEDAEIMRKKIEACFVMTVTTDNDTVTAGELTALQTGRDLMGEKVSPGMIKYLRPGESVDFGNPVPSAGGGEFTRRQLHAIAVGAGLTYAQLTGDMSQANFASNRMGLLQFRALMDQLQWLVFVPQVVQPIRAWFREAAEIAGRKIGNNVDRITMPKRAFVDPLKDALATKEAIRGGWTTLSEAIREQGDDPNEVFAERESELKQLAAAGIVTDSDAAVKELKLTPVQALAATQESVVP